MRSISPAYWSLFITIWHLNAMIDQSDSSIPGTWVINKFLGFIFYQSWSIFTCRLGNFGILFVILVIKTVEFKLNKTMLFSKLPLFLKPTWVHCCSNWQIIHGIRQFGTQYWKWMCNRLSLSLDVCLFLWMHSHTCVASGFHSNSGICVSS